MKCDCTCQYCKLKVDEYFCSTCEYNFNECESFNKFDHFVFCPKCHPKKENLDCNQEDLNK